MIENKVNNKLNNKSHKISIIEPIIMIKQT